MRHFFFPFLLIAVVCPAQAQWRATLLIGNATSRGDAQNDLDPQHPELRADRPSIAALSIARDGKQWRVAIDLHRASADLTEAGDGSSVTTPDLLKAVGAGIEMARRVAGSANSAALLVGVGATVDRWSFDLDDNSPRTRVAARGAIESDFPFSQRWSAVIRWQAVIGPSVFEANELPEGFAARTAVRSGFVLGVSRRF